jgi:hypothetical protein
MSVVVVKWDTYVFFIAKYEFFEQRHGVDSNC